MDGTYGNPIARSQSPMTPATPSTPAGQYQVNISRKKTKKWVEAKAQSYDGGGWGDDDEEESDEREPTPPMPPPAATYSPRLASESRGPFAPPPQQPAASSVPPNIARTASPLSVTTNEEAQSSSAARGGSPALPDSSASGATGEFSRNPSAQAHDAAHLEPSGANDSTHGQPGPGFDTYDGHNNGNGARGVSLHDTKQSPVNPPAASFGGEPALSNPQDIDRGKSSASPQIPAVSRMSGFGADMFASQFSKPADEPVQQDSQPAASVQKPPSPGPVIPASPSPPGSSEPSEGVNIPHRPTLPGGWVTETPSVPDVDPSETGAKPAEDGSDSRSTGFDGEAALAASDGRRNDQHVLPPLQTGAAQIPRSNTSTPAHAGSSPEKNDAAQRPVHESTSPRSDITDIPPTQPLQPRKPDYSPADYDLQPIHRQITQSTVTYSPVKESDMLRDEIMRTLSPTKEDAPDNKPPGPARKDTQETQESSYSRGVYDAYLAVSSGSKDDVQTPDAEAPARTEGVVTPPAGLVDAEAFGVPSPDAQNEPKMLETVPESEPASRQRFSWEVSKPSDQGPVAQPAPATTGPAVQSPASDKSDATAKDGLAAQVGAPDVTSPASPAVPSGAAAAQVPMVNVPLAEKDKASFQEPPSPVSAMSMQREPSNRSTLPGDHTPTATSPTGLSAPGQAAPPPPSAPTGATSQAQLPTFKDIMSMPTAAERIEKYDETRAAFASMDSGLEDWMTKLKAQHPEHADQTASFYGAGGQAQGPGLSAGAAAGAQTSSQQQPQSQPQPYYQQYLNATSPAMNAPPPPRNRIGSLPMQLQGATSTFGSSSNQIGTKGKEFMQSAGKMGKGLFNKGKSKLRGTGDKESKKGPPPANQPKPRHERRTSWSLSLGGRTRTGSFGPQSGDQRSVSATAAAQPAGADAPTPLSPPQQQPQPDATGAAAAAAGATTAAVTRPARPSHDLHDAPGHQSPASHERIENTADNTTTTTAAAAATTGTMSPGVIRDDRMGYNPSRQQGAWQPVAIGRPSMDQVSIDSDVQAGQGNRAFTPEPATYNKAPPFAAIPEDSGVALPGDSEPESEAATPKRNSFVGLPPIRRNSTLSSFDFLGEGNTDLQSFLKLDDDEDSAAETQGERVADEKSLPTPPSADASNAAVHASKQQDVDTAQPEQPVVQQEEQPRPSRDDADSLTESQDSIDEPVPAPDQEEKSLSEQVKAPNPGASPELRQTRPVTPPQVAKRRWEESAPPSPPPVQGSRLPPPPSQEEPEPPSKPIHQMPLAGPWKLEESYLVEPLNSVSRKRSDSGLGSPQPHSDGFEKETGLGGASTVGTDEHLPLMAPGRSRHADVPPSSARRYPELFPPRSENGGPRGPGPLKAAPQDYHRYMITQSRNGRPNEGNSRDAAHAPPSRDEPAPGPALRGPDDRRNSEQHGPPGSDVRPETPDMRGDAVSEASVNIDGRKKKRSSFLPGFRNANSTDASLPLSREVTNNRAQTPDSSYAVSENTEAQSDRKRSLFSSAAGAIAGKSPLKFGQSASNNSRPAQAEQASQGGNEHSGSKNRLAGLKMANLASRFNRVAQGHGRKPSAAQPAPGVALSAQPSTAKEESDPSARPASHSGAPATPDSPSSAVFFPPHPAVGETVAHHMRQASASGSGPDATSPGHRPTSRPQAKDEPTPRKISGGSLSPTHNPATTGVPYPGAPPHGPPQQPLPSIPAAPGSRGGSLEDRRHPNQADQTRASPRAQDFAAGPRSPPAPPPPPASDKPSPLRQGKHSHERQSSGQWKGPGGPRPPPFAQERNAQAQQPGPDDVTRSRAVATSPERPTKSEARARRTSPKEQPPPGRDHGSGQPTPSKGRQPAGEHAALVQQSPKPSADLARPPGAQPQPVATWQQGGPVKPAENADGAGRGGQAGAQGSQGSLWKGLRSKMTEQISHAAPRVQGKVGGTSSKLLGAIKRGPADQQSPNTTPPPGGAGGVGKPPGQGPPLGQWRPTQGGPQQQLPPPMHAQFPVGPANPGQQDPMLGRPGGPQGPLQGPPRPQRPPEPQYAQVPIPQGYQTVRGEGRVAPSPYSAVQPMHQQHQYAQQQQQVQPQQQHQHQYQHQQVQLQPQPQHPQQQQQQQMAQQGYLQQQQQRQQQQQQQQQPQQWLQHGQNPGLPRPMASPRSQDDIEQSPRQPGAMRGAGFGGDEQIQQAHTLGIVVNGQQIGRPRIVQQRSRNGSLASVRAGQPQQQQQRGNANTSPSMSDTDSLDRRPSQVSQASTQTASSNPTINGNGNGYGPKGPNSGHLGIDVQKAQQDREVDLYDATPKAAVAPTGGSGAAAGVAATSANVELEDTEEARKRTIRLESQEDKILADPEEETPQMSATSYPGQMWNPYGMEFVDWRDD